MDRNQFWQIIDYARTESIKKHRQIAYVTNGLYDLYHTQLLELSIEEILEFDSILMELLEESYDNLLWGVFYIATEWSDPASFTTFRAYMIAMGKNHFDFVQSNRESLLHGFDAYVADDIGWILLEAGSRAHIAKTGEDHPNPASSYDRKGKPIGKPLTQDYLNHLRNKNSALSGRDYDTRRRHGCVLDSPITQALTDRLKERATTISLEALLWEFLDNKFREDVESPCFF